MTSEATSDFGLWISDLRFTIHNSQFTDSQFLFGRFEDELVAEERRPGPGACAREGPRRTAPGSAGQPGMGQLVRHRRRLHGTDSEAAPFQEVLRAREREERHVGAVEDAAVRVTEPPEEESEPDRDVRHVWNGSEED